MYSTILFPTDGSEESLEALDHALDIARTYGAELHALYVIDTSYPYGDIESGVVNWDRIKDAFREEGERTVEKIEERAEETGTTFVGAVKEGSVVHRTILDYAEENDVDMIVMGTHGRRGLDRWILGSVTERVMRTAEVPVLTVRTGR